MVLFLCYPTQNGFAKEKKIKSDNGNKTYPWSNRGGEISLEYKTSKRYFINCEKENIKITNPR